MPEDFIGIKVPCGYGPPGSLPEPLPGGVDGGVVVVPGNPGGGGVIIGPPIINPKPGVPGVPNPPSSPPTKPTIINHDIYETYNTADLIVFIDQPVSLSAVVYNATESYTIYNPIDFRANWVLNFTGLTPNTTYNYKFVVREDSSLHLKSSATGVFTTLQAPIQTPTIVNQTAIFNTPNVLVVTWQTIYQGNVINTNSTLKVYNSAGIQVFLGTIPNTGTPIFNIPGLPFDSTYLLELYSVIPGNGSDIETIAIVSPKSVNIVNINTTVSYTDILLSFYVETDLGFDSPASATIVLKKGNTLVQTINRTNFISFHNVMFNNLTPGTLYDVFITVNNNFDIATKLVQLLTLQIPSGGIVIRNQTPVGSADPAPPVIIDPGNPTPPTQPIDPVLFPQDPPTPPTQAIDPVLFPQDPTGPTVPNIDPVLVPFLAEQANATLYGNFLRNSTYNESDIDLKYTPYRISPTGFSPVYSQDKVNVFSPLRHKSLQNILEGKTTTFEIANLDKENLTDNDIKRSLEPSLRKILYNLRFSNGIPIPESTISNSIKNYVYTQSVDNINLEYILSLSDLAAEPDSVQTVNLFPEKAEYGKNINAVKQSRLRRPTGTVNTQNLQRDSNYGLQLLKKSMKSINPNDYSDDSRELLKLWYCIPSDINKRVQILMSDGSVNTFYVGDDESVTYLDTASVVQTDYVSINDTIDYLNNSGQEDDYYVITDRDRARVIRNEDEQLIKYHLEVEDDITLEVSCANTNIEVEADNTDSISNHYVLVLDPTTLTETPNQRSPFIIETQAQYTLMTKSAYDVSVINNDVKYRAYPWLTLAIDHNDPILDYFEDSLATSNTYTFTFKDLTYNKMGAKLGNKPDILVRKIPKFVLVLPTDKTRYNLYNRQSLLTDWSVRKIRFEKSPDLQLNNTGLTTHPFTVENTFVNSLGESKSGFYSTQAYHCQYNTTSPTFDFTYNDPDNKPTRRQSSFRKAIEIINSLNTNFELDEGLTYYDVLSRLDRSEFYTLTEGVDATVLSKLEQGEVTNVTLYHIPGPTGKTISARASPTRIVELKPGGVDEYESQYAEFDILNAVAQAAQEPAAQVTPEPVSFF